MNTREAFEAWVMSDASRRVIPRDAYWNRYGVQRMSENAGGDYWNHMIELAWRTWEQCAAWAARECAEVAFDVHRKYRALDDEYGEGKSEGSKEAAQAIRAKFQEAFR